MIRDKNSPPKLKRKLFTFPDLREKLFTFLPSFVRSLHTPSSAEINSTGTLLEGVASPDIWISPLRSTMVENLLTSDTEWLGRIYVLTLMNGHYKRLNKGIRDTPGYGTRNQDLKSGLRDFKSNGDALRMARSLVSSSLKHCEVYVVDGVREGNGIEITSSDVDYVPEGGQDSGSGLIEVQVDAELEPSTNEEVFNDSADDGDHEDYFGFEVEDNDPQSNILEDSLAH
ncbi:hypothetical protein Ahy_B01g053594 isoform B [Arachis hypogaea]|uniref:Uncharacterized protein n=1 Tax=Arachis hypogaea TaxID=3818 RepID=A0A445AS54_ARAHY|nr:hypothetical protein Ahy_B01g053594 isoform B [Arachis hypogaea]